MFVFSMMGREINVMNLSSFFCFLNLELNSSFPQNNCLEVEDLWMAVTYLMVNIPEALAPFFIIPYI